jgi:alpha-tubulin suppressor-like RCC1 family protein
MPAPLTNFKAGGEDLADIYVDTNTVLDSLEDGTIPSSILSDAGITALQSRSIWVWGNGGQGLLGLNNTLDRSSPVQLGALTSWYDADISSAVSTNGSLWSWGSGRALLNESGYRSSPVQVGTLTNWKKIFDNRFAVKTDNTLWAWGNGRLGGLGLNNTLSRSSPTQVGGLTNWKQASGGTFFTMTPFGPSPGIFIQRQTAAALSVKTDGTLWAWGSNRLYVADNGGLGTSPSVNGVLGLNDIISRSSPVQVGALNNWKEVALSSGLQNAAAVKTDGTLWVWGGNSGTLGLNSTPNISSPAQLGTDQDWKQARIGLALKKNGTLWSWGGGAQMGLNSSIDRSSPTQVGALTDWNRLDITSSASTSNVIKTNGTWWSWGVQSVLNDTVTRSSPVQVGADTNWRTIKGTRALKR